LPHGQKANSAGPDDPAPCPIEVMKRVVSEMHMPEVTIAYGMTETSPVSMVA
jgi:acyl-CoA synthetase (AMP-forming)/AMP-acid ligase II